MLSLRTSFLNLVLFFVLVVSRSRYTFSCSLVLCLLGVDIIFIFRSSSLYLRSHTVAEMISEGKSMTSSRVGEQNQDGGPKDPP